MPRECTLDRRLEVKRLWLGIFEQLVELSPLRRWTAVGLGVAKIDRCDRKMNTATRAGRASGGRGWEFMYSKSLFGDACLLGEEPLVGKVPEVLCHPSLGDDPPGLQVSEYGRLTGFIGRSGVCGDSRRCVVAGYVTCSRVGSTWCGKSAGILIRLYPNFDAGVYASWGGSG